MRAFVSYMCFTCCDSTVYICVPLIKRACLLVCAYLCLLIKQACIKRIVRVQVFSGGTVCLTLFVFFVARNYLAEQAVAVKQVSLAFSVGHAIVSSCSSASGYLVWRDA